MAADWLLRIDDMIDSIPIKVALDSTGVVIGSVRKLGAIGAESAIRCDDWKLGCLGDHAGPKIDQPKPVRGPESNPGGRQEPAALSRNEDAVEYGSDRIRYVENAEWRLSVVCIAEERQRPARCEVLAVKPC